MIEMNSFMLHKTGTILGLLINLTLIASGIAKQPLVVAANKPIHSLIAGVMQEVETPYLLIETMTLNARDCQLSPEKEKILRNADLVVYISADLESCIARLELEPSQQLVLKEQPGIHLLAERQGSIGQKETAPVQEKIDPEKTYAPAHRPVENATQLPTDNFLWLSPTNAKAIIKLIADKLSQVDNQHSEIYQQNAAKLLLHLEKLDQQLAGKLAPVKDNPMVVLHDFYQYFEHHYQLHNLGAVSKDSQQDILPTDFAGLNQLREKIVALSHVCIVADPYSSKEQVTAIGEGANTTIIQVDPYALDMKVGKRLYFQLLTQLTDNLVGCLNPSS